MVYYVYHRKDGEIKTFNNKIELCVYLNKYFMENPVKNWTFIAKRNIDIIKRGNINNYFNVNIRDLAEELSRYKSYGIIISDKEHLDKRGLTSKRLDN